MQRLEAHKKAFSLMKRFHYLDHSIGPLSILLAIFKGTIPFIPLIFSKYIIKSVIDGEYTGAFRYVIAMAGIFAVASIFSDYLKKVVSDKNNIISLKIEDIIHRKPLELDYESMEDGKVISGYTSAINSLRYRASFGKVYSSYAKLLQHLVSFFLALGLTVQLCMSVGTPSSQVLGRITNPIFCIMVIIVVIVGMLGITGRVIKWIQKKESELFESKLDSERRFSYLARMFRDDEMVKTIQVYGAHKIMKSVLNSTKTYISKTYKSMGKYGVYEYINNSTASGIITVLAYGLVVLKILAGAIGIADFMKFSSAVIKMNESLLESIVVESEITDMMRYMDKLLEFLDMENKFNTGSIPVEKRSDHVYKICFEDVWFKYPGSEDYVIEGVTCEIESNGKCALVGPNGAGKSTFIKLLSRLYEPSKGRITLNGVDIKKYDYKEYLSLFSVVFQDFGLFSSNLGENIACTSDYNKNSVIESLMRMGLDKYESRLDDKDDLMDKGEALSGNNKELDQKYSGGEKQKIAIARALHKDGAFVILDEPTAALDPISEYEIYQNFDSLIGDKTCIYISHRMSSCRFCSDIIVLDGGQIVERGSHEKLIEDKKLYHEMWNAQAKYYKVS